MYNLEPKRKTLAIRGGTFVLCILAIHVGTTITGQNQIFAEDKSTSITCTNAGPCEKTECVNNDCETVATNSSNISSTTGPDEKEPEERKSLSDILKERLSMRGE